VLGLESTHRRGDFFFKGEEIGLSWITRSALDLNPRFRGVDSPLEREISSDLTAMIEDLKPAMDGIGN
jgi:hypothetical protein